MNTIKKFPLYLVFLLLLSSVSCSMNSSHPQDKSDAQDTNDSAEIVVNKVKEAVKRQQVIKPEDEFRSQEELLDLTTPIGDPPTTTLTFINGKSSRDIPERRLKNDTIKEIKRILREWNYILDDIKILKDDKSLEKYRKGGFVKPGEEKWLKIVYEIKAHPINEKGEIYEAVAQMPWFPGGDKALMAFIDHNIRYPKKMIQDSVHGKVVVFCVIEKDGSIEEYGIAKNLLKDKSGNPCTDSKIKKQCEEEALRIVRMMPRWEPGKNEKGEPVRVRYNIPVTFD